MTLLLFLLLFLALHVFLFFLSLKKVFHSHNKITFIYPWGFIFGAFVWEDLLVFSLFHALLALVVLVLSDIRLGLLGICVFWMIRSSGETLYFFLQQFINKKVYPHKITKKLAYFKRLLGGISDQKAFIILQVFHQTIVVVFTIFLIMLIKNWSEIPSWIW